MLREDIDRYTIFSTITGSNAYGLNTKDSDIDIRGVACLSDSKYYFGFLDKFEQFEDKSNDFVIYDIRKFFRLACDNNPNIIELLFTDQRFWQTITKEWEKIIEHKDKFLCKNIRYKFVGYAFAQLKRIKTARSWLLNPPKKKPERSDFGLPEKKLLSKDDLGAFRWVMVNLLKDSIEYLNFTPETQEELREANFIGLVQSKGIPEEAFEQVQKITGASDAWMSIMKQEQGYINAKRHYDSYMSWKNGRNEKRAVLEEKFGYDTKHAMHLVRLMRMGKEIMETGEVKVFRPDRDELLEIRNGSWKYDDLEDYAHKMESEIIGLYQTSTLPKEPNRKFLSRLCEEIISEKLKR